MWPVGMGLVVRRDGLWGDGAVAADLEAVAGGPFPDFGCAGLPLGTGDLGAWLPCPGHPDGLGNAVGGAPAYISSAKPGEHGAGRLRPAGTAGLLAFQRPHGIGEFFQAEDADRVIEQAELGRRLGAGACGHGNRQPGGMAPDRRGGRAGGIRWCPGPVVTSTGCRRLVSGPRTGRRGIRADAKLGMLVRRDRRVAYPGSCWPLAWVGATCVRVVWAAPRAWLCGMSFGGTVRLARRRRWGCGGSCSRRAWRRRCRQCALGWPGWGGWWLPCLWRLPAAPGRDRRCWSRHGGFDRAGARGPAALCGRRGCGRAGAVSL